MHVKSLVDPPDHDTDDEPLIEGEDDEDKALVAELRKLAGQAQELTTT
jgi:hypothetical protein